MFQLTEKQQAVMGSIFRYKYNNERLPGGICGSCRTQLYDVEKRDLKNVNQLDFSQFKNCIKKKEI